MGGERGEGKMLLAGMLRSRLLMLPCITPTTHHLEVRLLSIWRSYLNLGDRRLNGATVECPDRRLPVTEGFILDHEAHPTLGPLVGAAKLHRKSDFFVVVGLLVLVIIKILTCDGKNPLPWSLLDFSIPCSSKNNSP